MLWMLRVPDRLEWMLLVLERLKWMLLVLARLEWILLVPGRMSVVLECGCYALQTIRCFRRYMSITSRSSKVSAPSARRPNSSRTGAL